VRLSDVARAVVSIVLLFAALACLSVGIVLFPEIEWLAILLWLVCLLVAVSIVLLNWIRGDE